MEKICFVVQRYGLEVNGGAELHCRQLAEHMLGLYDVDVLTTKAIDYMTWQDEYTADEEDIHGVHVRRFSVSHPRDINEFNTINAQFMAGQMPESRELEWVDKQGPAVPELLTYIRTHKNEYKAMIFFTYLYYQTVMGVREAAEKAIVIPTAHDEPFLRMKIYDQVFKTPRAFFFNTSEERQMIHEKYHNEDIPSALGGVGVDVPEDIQPDRFKQKYGLGDYMVYVGRIDEGKNCDWLFKYFLEYKRRKNHPIQLVLMGKAVIPVPEDKDIISLGFVDDQDKFDGMAGARLLVLPSEFESLSMVVLEAMNVYTPVLVNGKCPVLKGHCIKGNGSLYYNDYFEYEGAVNYILENEAAVGQMVKNARAYVDANYQWKTIVERLSCLIEQI